MAANDEPSPQSDLEVVCRLIAEGKPITDLELLKRIEERSEQATREIFGKKWPPGRRCGIDSRRSRRGMKYVLNSNVALKWVLRESDSDKARQLRIEYQRQIHELLAPDVFPIEVAHGWLDRKGEESSRQFKAQYF